MTPLLRLRAAAASGVQHNQLCRAPLPPNPLTSASLTTSTTSCERRQSMLTEVNVNLLSQRNQPQHDQQRRNISAYGFGQQWTGALSRGPSRLVNEEAAELSPEEIRQFGEPQAMVPLIIGAEEESGGSRRRCIAASAGWGHTALLVEGETNEKDVKPELMVCGRPHDFQQLMRLRRLPSFARNFCVRHTLPAAEDEESDQPPSVLQRIASYLAGENEYTINEAECRRFSNVPTLLRVDLPDGEAPALEGEEVPETAFESHAAGRILREEGAVEQTNRSPPLHARFQNTLAASAGVTAVISESGTLYAFGLNHRGQCGTGYFSPNVWSPSRVAGLGCTRFILDHGTDAGEDMFRNFKEQEHPIISVALGLQHGVALDSEGQVFCWGKGERGQLGQGRRMAHKGDAVEEEPNENRTFEYALQVANFYDPYDTIRPSPGNIYAPLLSADDSKVRLISAGMNFTVAITNSNLPYVWGKNVCLNPSYSESGINVRAKPVRDSTYPMYVAGLPDDLRVERVACGTHHVAMLMEDGSIWAVGVATDRPVPLWDEAVEMLAPGLVEMGELVSFTAGFDRTVVVYGTGGGRRQAVEIQLWSNEDLRLQGAVQPSWMDWLQGLDGRKERVRSVHRGWMHSIVVTEEE